MPFPNSDLKNAYQGLARAFEVLDLQQETYSEIADRPARHEQCRSRLQDHATETHEEDRREIEEESDQHEGQRTAQVIRIRAIHLGWTTVAIL